MKLDEKRILISLPEEMKDKINREAEKGRMKRTAFIRLALSEASR